MARYYVIETEDQQPDVMRAGREDETMPETYTLRDKALSLPVRHPARIKYRDYIRGQANAREEARHAIETGGNATHGHLIGDHAARQIAAVEAAVNAAIEAGENERPLRHL